MSKKNHKNLLKAKYQDAVFLYPEGQFRILGTRPADTPSETKEEISEIYESPEIIDEVTEILEEAVHLLQEAVLTNEEILEMAISELESLKQRKG